MSDTTPQNDDVTIDDSAEVEINDSVPESETGEQVQAESDVQVDEVEVAKQKSNEAFNKQYGQLKQAERDNEAQASKIAQFEQAERERAAAAVGNIPAMPDAFDDDFEAKIKIRDEAIVAQANYNASNQAHLQQQQFQQQQAAQAAQVEQDKALVGYATKANDLGIKQDELNAAANTVAQYGLSNELVMHIVKDSDGPLITKHLAANPQDGHMLASMSPYLVGQFLTDIKTKASALKPKKSSAPAPSESLSGNGVDPEMGKYKHISGVKYT